MQPRGLATGSIDDGAFPLVASLLFCFGGPTLLPYGRRPKPAQIPDRTCSATCCACAPNHHLLFDYGAFTLDDNLRVTGTDTRLRTVPAHQVEVEFLRYHRDHYG